MGERQPRVSTRRGDDGTTRLLGGVDGASSFLGLVRAESSETDEEVAELLLDVQRFLYRMTGDVAAPGEKNVVGKQDLAFVEYAFEGWRDRTELPGELVVPGEGRLVALLDVSRTVAPRAERSAVAAGFARDHPEGLRILNRLSGLLFVVSRHADGKATPSKR